MSINNIEKLNALVERVKAAQKIYATFSQEQVDKIFHAAALAAADARIPLAKMAVSESGMGVVEDKVIKNHFASEYIYNAYKDEKTCGVLEEDDTFGTITIAEPIGIICGIVPTTNPTSTAIFKALISLKTRNAIIFSPHPRARNATNEAAKIVLRAAIAAGAPADLIGWIDEPSVELSNALMHHPDINLILATGGPGMVKAAYSSGKPAIGVGAGNTPVVIDETADIKRAVASVLMAWLESIKAELGIPNSIREAGVQEVDFLSHVDKLAEDAFDDQCTGANPRYPLIAELKQILLDSFYGLKYTEEEMSGERLPVNARHKQVEKTLTR